MKIIGLQSFGCPCGDPNAKSCSIETLLPSKVVPTESSNDRSDEEATHHQCAQELLFVLIVADQVEPGGQRLFIDVFGIDEARAACGGVLAKVAGNTFSIWICWWICYKEIFKSILASIAIKEG